jgi:hypothetical protein
MICSMADYDFWAGLQAVESPARVGHSTRFREWSKVLRLDPCAYCGRPLSGTVDHITPHKMDPALDTPENLTGACVSCNGEKGERRSLLSMLSCARFAPPRVTTLRDKLRAERAA